MPLRPYQMACIEQVREAVRALRAAQRPQNVVLVLPTGGGKTRTAAEMVRSCVDKGGRALWGVNRYEVADQAFDALTDLGLRCGMNCASSAKRPQPFAPVQVGTFQSLIARDATIPANLIIFDEAHHAAAKSYAGYVARYPGVPLIGLTATPERGDGKGLGDMFSSLVVGARIKQLIDLGHLVPANLIRPARKLRSGEIAQRPVDAWLQHARGQRTIVFSPSVLIAEEHAAEFRALGVAAKMVEGNTDASERRQAFADLRSGATPVLCNVYIATEGFDIPAVSSIILARGCGHAGTYLQMVGRGLRPAEGKRECVVIDLQGISHDHGHPADDREYSLTGRGISEPGGDAKVVQRYCKVCSAALEADAIQCPVCGTECGAPPQTITGDALVPYQVALARDSPEVRASRLAKWMMEPKKDGTPRKESAAMHKYVACYPDEAPWPRAYIIEAARRIIREKQGAPQPGEEWG